MLCISLQPEFSEQIRIFVAKTWLYDNSYCIIFSSGRTFPKRGSAGILCFRPTKGINVYYSTSKNLPLYL